MRLVTTRLRDERGWGLVSSVLVVGILISLSLPLLSLVDNQQRQTTHERKSESSFNLAEAALDASVFVLGKTWPADESRMYPEACTPQSTTLSCPDAELLASSYTGVDYSDRTWTIQVRDDAGSDYYDPAVIPDLPTWDANDNEKLWVRADARAAEGNRSVVALVRRIDRNVQFPRNAITAGWFVITTGGNKVVVDTQGNMAQPAPVAVRCNEPAPSSCLNYRPDRRQVSPDTTQTGFANETALPPEIIESFREKAKALNTYFPSGCPASPAGEVVFIENGDCHYAGGGTANSATSPGMLIVGNGTIEFSGSMTYHGLVYAANLQRSTGEIATVRGAATIVGSIAADAGGGVRLGSNGHQLIYSDTIFGSITSFSAAAWVQGSWRELPAS